MQMSTVAVTLPAATLEDWDKTLSDFVNTSGGTIGLGIGAAAAAAANLEAVTAEDDAAAGTDGIPPAFDNGCISEARESTDNIAFRWEVVLK